jgi:hypothetical protein
MVSAAAAVWACGVILVLLRTSPNQGKRRHRRRVPPREGDPPSGGRSHCEPRSECPPAEPGSIVHDVHGQLTLNMLPSFAQLEREVTGEWICTRNVAALRLTSWAALAAGWLPAQVGDIARQPSPSSSSRKTSADSADFPAGSSRSHASIRCPTLPRPRLARDQPCQARPIRESRAAHAARVG